MVPQDCRDYIAQLEACGLVKLTGDDQVDLIEADQRNGFARPCPLSFIFSRFELSRNAERFVQ